MDSFMFLSFADVEFIVVTIICIFSLVILLLCICVRQGPVRPELVAWQHLQCVPSRSLLRTGDGKAGIAAALGVSFGTNHSRHAQS